MKWIGLTGGIASGKSTVSQMIVQAGIAVIDADRLAHKALEPDSEIYPRIVELFGKTILMPDKSINRAALGQIVFPDPHKISQLEALIHPYVKRQALAARKNLEKMGKKIGVYDVPLLFEKNMEKDFDEVLIVYSPQDQQLARLLKRNALTHEQALQRIRVQIPMEEKKRKPGYIIDNSGSLSDLESQVQKWLQLQPR